MGRPIIPVKNVILLKPALRSLSAIRPHETAPLLPKGNRLLPGPLVVLKRLAATKRNQLSGHLTAMNPGFRWWSTKK